MGLYARSLFVIMPERYDCQLLGDVQAFCNGRIGHVKMPQLRNLPGDLPVDGDLDKRRALNVT